MESSRARIEAARETQEALERIRRDANPTADDIAALHELHAAHERQHGRIERAEEAEARAERARSRASAARPERPAG